MRVKVTASADRQDAIRTATAQPAPVLIVRTSIAGEVATPKAAVPDRDRVLAADVKKAAVEASSKDAQATGNAFNGIEVGTVAQRMRKDVHKPKSKYPTFISKPSEGLQYTSDTVKSFGSGEMSNTQYKVMQVASNPSNALDSAERNAIVIKKWPADGGRKSIEKPRNTTSQASKRKSTHDRTFDLAKVDQLTDESMAAGENMRNVVKYFRSQSTNNSETYVQPSVTEVRSIEPSTDASAKTGTAGNQPQQESSIPQPEPMETAALTSSIGAQQGLEVQSKRFPSPDGAAKVSREIKSLKETQSQSKVLAEFLDGASRQGKLRKRRSSSVSPAGTNASKQLPPAAAGSGIAHRKRLQSRCFVEDPEDPSPVGLTNRRTGMRSENEDFKMKQQRFLHNLHDKATEAMDDSVEEDTSHDLPMTANDSLSSFGSDGVMKSLDETFGSVAEPPKPGYDRYCFRCKQSRGEQLVGCNSCVRSFHQGCTRPTYSDDNWTCQECRSSSLAHETNPFPTEGYVNLHDCLQSLVESLLGTPDAFWGCSMS
ncbi:AGAP002983-PA-like protein [Anopheles sinensis]|uniref:AGAP002983-PA-like protein n=1 Tax=Anopheles sinensis TaxID=74873 RepID=A0A084VJB8_ANOSI|nr:AGAP002983-PA-like protein [Anopheles sinensis]